MTNVAETDATAISDERVDAAIAEWCGHLWREDRSAQATERMRSDMRAALSAAALPPSRDDVRPRVAECVKEYEEEARWLTCSGCYDTEDGHPTANYPFSEAFGCALGNGCSECGGIGAVWDTTDYEEMARELLAEDEPAQQPIDRATVIEALLAAKELAKTMGGLTACRSDDDWIWGAQAKIDAAILALSDKEPTNV